MFNWLLLDLLVVRPTSYKQVSKQLAKSILNGENMDNSTALYMPNLGFTFGTNSMQASPRGNGIFVFVLAFSYSICCSSSGSKTVMGTTDQMQIALASLVEGYTCRSNSTSNRII